MNKSSRVLVLGGSTQARALVGVLRGKADVVLSYAGTTASTTRHQPPGVQVRVGGFGGVEGLTAYLQTNHIDALVDATHPYAATMHANAIAGTQLAGVAHIRLERPAWTAPPGATWYEVDGGAGAADAVVANGYRRVLVSTGRTHLDPWKGLGNQVTVVLRSIDPPEITGIDSCEVITARGPFSYADEVALLADCDALVTRNAGGDDAKIRAARDTHTPIIVLNRPPALACTRVATVEEVLDWLCHHGFIAGHL